VGLMELDLCFISWFNHKKWGVEAIIDAVMGEERKYAG